jgi:LuxR family maltose regulon positive regulatory protein
MSAHLSLSPLELIAPSAAQAVALPRLPATHVRRARLVDRLVQSDCRLRMLHSPAGFGKTVVLNECARRVPGGTALVWLELQGRALSAQTFIRLLAEAIHPAAEAIETTEDLLRLLRRLDKPLWVMLDDYPREPNAELDACFDMLLEQAPGSVSWWVAGRLQPGWNLPRLLLKGELCELDAQSLALTAEELAQLVRNHRLGLSQESVDALLKHSEGWLAGVCLLLLNADEESFHERLSGGTPFLRDYICREIMDSLSAELRGALFALVHLPRFSESLCDHILEGGAALLAQLRTRQLFVRPLDSCGDWFRIWRPLALMLPRLPGAMPAGQVYVRACQWFAARGHLREAVEHALWAGQPEVAASFLQRFDQEQLLVGRSVAQFLAWRQKLPRDIFTSTPRLIMLQAWALIIGARLDEAESCLAELQHCLPQPDATRQAQLLAHWQAIVGVLQRHRGEKSARKNCLEALQVLSEKAWSLRVLCHQTVAQHALAEANLQEADLHIGHALRLARLNGSILFEALLNIDRIHLLDLSGEPERALELSEQALEQLQFSAEHGPVMGRLQLQRGFLLASQGRDAESAEAYQKGSQEAQDSEDAHTIFGFLGRSELAARKGDFNLAFQRLREAERLMQWRHIPEMRYQTLIQFTAGGLWQRQGEFAKAREEFEQILQYYQDNDLLAPSACYDLIARVRRSIAITDVQQGRPEVGARTLQGLLAETERQGLRKLACECRFSYAEALHVAGEAEAAEYELRRALGEAEAFKLMRPLLELQLRRGEWLKQAMPARKSLPVVRVLQTVDSGEGALAGVEGGSPLSSRELAVLRLIALGCSNQEIAEQLFISLHTVKTHARRINSKLGVARRTQAVARAKGLGLLS